MSQILDNDQVTLDVRVMRNNKLKIRVSLKPGEIVNLIRHETVFNLK